MKLWTLNDVEILIVDDFPAMRSMVRSMLAGFGANNVSQARNGEEALALIAQKRFAIVLCDYNLGEGKDGQQVLEEAKEADQLPYSSLFIMITAENTSDMVMGAMDYQPDDYLVKPFTKVVLQSRIRKVQERKEGLEPVAEAMQTKDYARAIALLDQSIRSESKNRFELLRLKGELLLTNMDATGAQQHYSNVLQIREVAWANFGLGRAKYLLKQYIEAENEFSRLINDNKQFVPAYDWLAKVQQAKGEETLAQQTLQKAVALSPKAVRRQQALGRSALKNQNLDVAEKAFKNVIREGKNSCFRGPDDFGGLAQVYVESKRGDSASQLLDTMRQTFRGASDLVRLKSAVVDSVVNKALGHTEKSKAAIQTAMQLYQENPGNLTTEQALVMADTCFRLGEKDSGAELMKHVVRNNHEDAAILAKAKQVFDDNGLAGEGDSLIAATTREVIDVNNEGVELVKQGKLAESIRLFQRAARAMPENTVINLNVAQSMIMAMQANGVNQQQLDEVRGFLNRVAAVDVGNERYRKLLDRFQGLRK